MTVKVKEPKVKTNKGNLVSLLRKLRPMLPGEVEKLAPTEYRIQGEVLVKMNYYCLWSADGKDKTKECHPHSISVSDDQDYHKRFKARTFHENKQGEFNLKSIATAVTQALETVEVSKQAKREKEQAEKQKQKRKKDNHKHLGEILPKCFKESYDSYEIENLDQNKHNESRRRVMGSIYVQYHSYDREEFSYSAIFNYLTEEQLLKITQVAEELFG